VNVKRMKEQFDFSVCLQSKHPKLFSSGPLERAQMVLLPENDQTD